MSAPESGPPRTEGDKGGGENDDENDDEVKQGSLYRAVLNLITAFLTWIPLSEIQTVLTPPDRFHHLYIFITLCPI